MPIENMANKRNKQVMIFDLDNTLIDSGAKLIADIVKTFARIGYKVTPEEIAQYENWYERAETYGISKEIFDKSFNQRKTWKESLNDGEISIFPETYKVLNDLKQSGLRLSLLSKSIPEYTNLKLKHFDLSRYFEYVSTIHPKEPSKNSAAINLIRKMNPETIEKAYFIGDKEEDVIAEKAVREEFKDYELTTRGIYINRKGNKLGGYISINSLDELYRRK